MLRVLDSSGPLEKMGYEFERIVEPGVEPERVNVRFRDILPQLSGAGELSWIADARLYKHQYEALKALDEGRNVILRSGTGSGKTEAWVMYALRKCLGREGFRAIAIYPTLALANDQVRRITTYASAVGVGVIQLDAPSRDKLVKSVGRSGVRTRVAGSGILITNPAFLMHEIRRFVLKPSSSLLEPFFRKLSLLVIDELDFYGPREIALLLGMLEVIALASEVKPQIVVLTATLANPDELGEHLKRVTGRDYTVIEGEAFHVENHTFIMLGKNMRRVWERIREITRRIPPAEIDEDVLEALRDYGKFRENAHRVLSYLEALGFDVPKPGVDPAEIISLYARDEGVTLVFTRGIARAEEIAKRVGEIIGNNAVAAHHHLVPKDRREEIEKAAREGRIKILVSPRTLTQGIDIGTIVRVVHLGLPEDVREYVQREGRKGRRPGIPFTETIVIPSGSWDWELLSKGMDALKKWLSLPLEKTIVNPGNLYMKLFTGLVKLLSPWLGAELTGPEKEALEKAGVLKRGVVDRERMKWVWDRLGFYEFAPPYGVKRELVENGFRRELEPIGHCDLVELFQIGCFDYTSDAIVVDHRTVAGGRAVTAVIEKPVRKMRWWEQEYFACAYEEYQSIKTRWGEEPSILRDLARGRVFSRVNVVVYPPRKGFGMLVKIPNRVVWIVVSEKPRVFKMGGKHIVSRDRRLVQVPTPVHGLYRDFTYGYLIEVDERLDTGLLRLGIAFTLIVLRRTESLPLDTLEYGVEVVGGKKFIEIHEPEASGVLELLDWSIIRRRIEEYKPDDLDLVLLHQLDEIAYTDMITLGIDWDHVREYALRVVDYIAQQKTVPLRIGEVLARIPKPSRSLRLVALDALVEPLEEDTGPKLMLVALACFDGEEARGYATITMWAPGLKPPRELMELEEHVENLVYYEDYTLLVPTKRISENLIGAGIRRLPRTIEEKSVEVLGLLEKAGFKPATLEPIMMEAYKIIPGIPRPPGLQELHDRLRRIKEKGFKSLLEKEKDMVLDYLKARAVAIYLGYLLSSKQDLRASG